MKKLVLSLALAAGLMASSAVRAHDGLSTLSAVSGVPRRIARRALMTRTDHSYQWLVCRP